MALLPILWGWSVCVLITDEATGQSGDEDGGRPKSQRAP
jgi:hypothetical protein